MGKTAILMVFSLVMLFTFVLPNIHRMSNDAVTNYMTYAKSTRGHNIAVSGANMAANKYFLSPTWRTGYSNQSFAGGKFSVTMEDLVGNWVRLTSIGEYEEKKDTVVITFQPATFALYAYYSVSEGDIRWATGDVLKGPFHTQDSIKTTGSPIFNGKTTTRRGNAVKYTQAVFNASYQTGVNVPMVSNFDSVLLAAGSGGKVFSSGDVWVTLNGTDVGYKTSATGSVTTTSLSLFAPNGVVVAASGSVHVQGTLHGQLTLAALQTGKIYIDDDVKYQTDPRNGPSTDLLGLLSDNEIIITNNSANNNGCVVMATVFSRTSGLTAQDYDSRPVSGTLEVLGGIVQYQRKPVGTLNFSGNVVSGFQKNYVYDNRLRTTCPPAYPKTGTFQIISWLE